MKRIYILLLALFITPSLYATNWYVRADGGTRWSVNVTAGQCNGMFDASYASTGGSGVNQNCAFNDVRYLWTDASGTTNPNAGAPLWGFIGAGCDHYLIRNGPWRVGQSGPNSGDGFGLLGDPYAGTPSPPSGTSGCHTVIRGENFASCNAQSSRTQLHGGYGTGAVLTMNGTSYVDISCLDITDYSNCGRAAQTHSCQTFYPLDDYATNGITWDNTATNDTLTNVRVHGLASTGMLGPTGTGTVFNYLDIIGNAGAGWNADAGGGVTGTGTLLVQNFNISWNGCTEEYPIVDTLPYQDCTDDNIGGYGDGFGTATVVSSPAWHVDFEQGTVSYNTQDGIDGLHLQGGGSTLIVNRVLAYGNMGNQIKNGAAGSVTNNQINANCYALSLTIPGTPSGYNSRLSDFCRAGNEAFIAEVQDGSVTTVAFNTIYGSGFSAGGDLGGFACNGTCTTTAALVFKNNIQIGFDVGLGGGLPARYTDGTGATGGVFAQTGSVISNNVAFDVVAGLCPVSGETNTICGDPGLVDETWHSYGFGNMAPASGSSTVVGAGITCCGITVDYADNIRPNPPTIGAWEWLGSIVNKIKIVGNTIIHGAGKTH